MSHFKVKISKHEIARQSDDNITYEDPDGTDDVRVTMWFDDQEIHGVTLTDAGAVLEYNSNITEGYHTVKIVPDAGKPTDVRIDYVIIDDDVIVGSQYLLDTRIFGKDYDFMTYKCCKPFKAGKNKDYVWWGHVMHADHVPVSRTTLYRPHIVTDQGEWWEWSFSVTAAGHLFWTLDDSDSVLYDSTENHVYYAARTLLLNSDATQYPVVDVSQLPDDSTVINYEGPGTYDESFNFITANFESTSTTLPIYSEAELIDAAWYYHCWHPANTVVPITVS